MERCLLEIVVQKAMVGSEKAMFGAKDNEVRLVSEDEGVVILAMKLRVNEALKIFPVRKCLIKCLVLRPTCCNDVNLIR